MKTEETIIKNIHDNKLWGLEFKFDARSLDPFMLVMDIDYIIDSTDNEDNNKFIFQVCPAYLLFHEVSSFTIHIDSGQEEENTFNSDCLYIYHIQCQKINEKKSFFQVVFCNDIGEISFYAKNTTIEYNEKDIVMVEGNFAIPLKIREKIRP